MIRSRRTINSLVWMPFLQSEPKIRRPARREKRACGLCFYSVVSSLVFFAVEEAGIILTRLLRGDRDEQQEFR